MSQLFFKIEKIRAIYEILWGKNKEAISHLGKDIQDTISYTLLYAFLDNLNEVFAPEKSKSSGTTLYKLIKFMEEHKGSQSEEIAYGIMLMIYEYENDIKSIARDRLKPLRNKLLVHLDKNSNEELVKENQRICDYTVDYSCFRTLMIFAEDVVKFTRIMEKRENEASSSD